MFSYRFILCVVIGVCLRDVRGALNKTDISKIHDSIAPALEECAKQHSLEKEDFLEAKKKNDFSSIDSCFFACMLAETEMLEDGKFQSEKAIEKIKEFISDEDDAKKMTEIIGECAEEVGEDIGEGDEACKKSLLMFTCFEKRKFHMD